MNVFERYTQPNWDLVVAKIEQNDKNLEFARNFLSQTDQQMFDNAQSPKRKIEIFAVRWIAKIINHNKYLDIYYDQNHKPCITNGYIGISHTNDYIAVIFSKLKNAAIDIETISDRPCKIATKFLGDEEKRTFDTTNNTLCTLLWSIKECAYKIYSHKQLSFGEKIKISKFDLQNKGNVEVLVDNRLHYLVNYKIFEDFVLSYCIEN